MINEILPQEQLNSAIRVLTWTVGFIFCLSAGALFINIKNIPLFIFITIFASGIILLILIWFYPEKEKLIQNNLQGGKNGKVEENNTEPKTNEEIREP